MEEDHRKSQRRKALKGARIVSQGGRASVSCTVRNLSADGAMLQGANFFGLAAKLTLVFDDGSPSRECTVRWNAIVFMGVKFT